MCSPFTLILQIAVAKTKTKIGWHTRKLASVAKQALSARKTLCDRDFCFACVITTARQLPAAVNPDLCRRFCKTLIYDAQNAVCIACTLQCCLRESPNSSEKGCVRSCGRESVDKLLTRSRPSRINYMIDMQQLQQIPAMVDTASAMRCRMHVGVSRRSALTPGCMRPHRRMPQRLPELACGARCIHRADSSDTSNCRGKHGASRQ